MGDNGNLFLLNKTQDDEPGEPTVKLIIELQQDGVVKVQGPIHDKIFCYGLLEMAKDAIRFRREPAPMIKRM